MSEGLTVHCKMHFKAVAHGRKQMTKGEKAPVLVGRVPRVNRLMALAIRFDELLRKGEVKDYAELARLSHVTRARVTQIMNLLNLAPEIQERLLFLSPTVDGPDKVKEYHLRPIAAAVTWELQRRRFRAIVPEY